MQQMESLSPQSMFNIIFFQMIRNGTFIIVRLVLILC